LTLGEDYDIGEDGELEEGEKLVEAPNFSREVAPTRHRTKAYAFYSHTIR